MRGRYTMYYEYHRYGVPLMRPMLMEFPNELLIHNYNDQFMFGASILVKPDEDLQVDEP